MNHRGRSSARCIAAAAQGACFLKEMGALVVDDMRCAFAAVTYGSRLGRALTVLWGITFVLYTTLDDIPAGIIFGAVAASSGLASAIAAVGLGSTTLAWLLADVQRRRILGRPSRTGSPVSVRDDALWKDLVSTYGIGVPATVLAYPSGRVPSVKRVFLLSIFYGFVGQAASYAGFQSAGELVGVDPDLALAVGIGTAIFYRYATAVRERRAEVRSRALHESHAT